MSVTYYFPANMVGGEDSCCHRSFPPTALPDQPVVRDRFLCQGTENSLSECPRRAGSECGHTSDVSVICS